MAENTQQAHDRRLVIFDVDGTLTRVTSIWQYLLERTGRWRGEGEVNLARFLAGAIDYAEFCRLDAGLLKGQRYDDLKRLARQVPTYDGLEAVFAYFRTRGFQIGLLSTGLKLLTDVLAERYPVDCCVVNELAWRDGRCTGEGIIRVAWHGKGEAAAAMIRASGAACVVAFGDSSGDVPVFRLADFRVAVNATDPELLRLASYRHVGDDLSACLPHLPF